MALFAWPRATPRAVMTAAGQAMAWSASGAGAGTAAGSATAGSGQGTSPGALAGLGSRVLLGGSGWQVLIIAGAMLVAASGIVVVVRSARLPAMSGRFDRPAGRAVLVGAVRHHASNPPAQSAADLAARPASENMWDSLSAGADPTIGPE